MHICFKAVSFFVFHSAGTNGMALVINHLLIFLILFYFIFFRHPNHSSQSSLNWSILFHPSIKWSTLLKVHRPINTQHFETRRPITFSDHKIYAMPVLMCVSYVKRKTNFFQNEFCQLLLMNILLR